MSGLLSKVRFEAADEIYFLEFTPNGMCAFEDIDPKGRGVFEALAPFLDVASASQDYNKVDLEKLGKALRFSDLRAMFWAGLQEHHEETIKTQKDAGKIMLAANACAGSQSRAMELCLDAIMRSFPDVEDSDDASGTVGNEGKV